MLSTFILARDQLTLFSSSVAFQFPDRPLLGVREKIKPAALPPFYETAAKMERSRGPLRPLSSLSYNKTTRDRLTDEENHLLADLVFNSESITLSSFLVDALILLVSPRTLWSN